MAGTTDMRETVPDPDFADVLPLRLDGDPVLRKRARPVAAVTAAVRDLARRMVQTLYASHGIGLAAPQVGRSLRLIVVDTRHPEQPPGPQASPGEILLEPRMPLVLVNPDVVRSSHERSVCSEGCLSVPQIYADVARPERVVVKAQTLDGQEFEVECAGLLGRCLQHEIDHLNGILFIDRLTKTEFARIARDVTALEKQTRASLKKGGD
jgi:peptide deformylase